VPIALKSGSLKLLEHSVPVQACNGINKKHSGFIEYPRLLGCEAEEETS
jgi:hypothetical protein